VDGWRLLGLNMAEWLIPVYVFFLAAFSGLWLKWTGRMQANKEASCK
jgi:disulfide bond formation protein DsbB